MADYSLFPWDTLTRDEIAKLMIHSRQIGDDDFVKACVEQLKRRPTKDAPDFAETCRQIGHWWVNGVCQQCGSKEPQSG
ncbi:MAG: hypothetical protein WC714_28730 [Candidatus Obscuribacterales bacterium]|jgi:hypothetical protein